MREPPPEGGGGVLEKGDKILDVGVEFFLVAMRILMRLLIWLRMRSLVIAWFEVDVDAEDFGRF